MEIKIYRYRIRESTCDGKLIIDGERICDTAENVKYRPPAGTYQVVLRYKKEQGRKVPVLIGNSSLRGNTKEPPFIAIGNGVYNRHDGRIIVGTYIVPGCLKNSRKPFMQLFNRINQSQRRGKEVTLTIIE